jgi:hypothetical protein
MNKYTQTYINELTKLAQDPVIAKPVPKTQDKGMLREVVAAGGDRQKAQQISDKLTAIKSDVQTKMDKNTLPDSDKTRKLLGIPANAKPSEADLNDRAGYK